MVLGRFARAVRRDVEDGSTDDRRAVGSRRLQVRVARLYDHAVRAKHQEQPRHGAQEQAEVESTSGHGPILINPEPGSLFKIMRREKFWCGRSK